MFSLLLDFVMISRPFVADLRLRGGFKAFVADLRQEGSHSQSYLQTGEEDGGIRVDNVKRGGKAERVGPSLFAVPPLSEVEGKRGNVNFKLRRMELEKAFFALRSEQTITREPLPPQHCKRLIGLIENK